MSNSDFLFFGGVGGFFEKFFLINLIFDQNRILLISKSFLQFETPQSLVLFPTPTPDFKNLTSYCFLYLKLFFKYFCSYFLDFAPLRVDRRYF